MTRTLISVVALLALAAPTTATAMESTQRGSDPGAYGWMPTPGCLVHEMPPIYDNSPTRQEDCLPGDLRRYNRHTPPFAPRKPEADPTALPETLPGDFRPRDRHVAFIGAL